MSRIYLAVTAAALAVIAALWIWPAEQVEPGRKLQRLAAEPVGSTLRPPRRGEHGNRVPARAEPGEWKSLRQTVPDGALASDESGNLILDPGVLRFFDYYFLASGEVADSVIVGRIEAEIEQRLEEPARSQAIDLLASYLDYRRRAAALYAASGDGETVEERILAIADLRSETFGDDAPLLFGEDLEYALVAAHIERTQSDASLSPEERERQVAALEAELPAEVVAARRAATAPLELSRDEAALRAAGGNQDEVQRLREDRFGAEAADRLAALDRRRNEWRGRVDQFRRQRSLIESDANLDPVAKQRAVDALIEDSFDENERLRVRALDRIELGRE